MIYTNCATVIFICKNSVQFSISPLFNDSTILIACKQHHHSLSLQVCNTHLKHTSLSVSRILHHASSKYCSRTLIPARQANFSPLSLAARLSFIGRVAFRLLSHLSGFGYNLYALNISCGPNIQDSYLSIEGRRFASLLLSSSPTLARYSSRVVIGEIQLRTSCPCSSMSRYLDLYNIQLYINT